MPTVSVIIPLYKSAAFIAETLDSVLNQTHADLEVLCVDDRSPDNTAEIVGEYAKRDKRVRLLSHENNMGAPAFGRNTGLKAVQGEYVTFLDHDDTFLPTKLEELLAAMHEEKVGFICSNIWLINAKTGKTDGPAWGNVAGDPKKGFRKRLLEGNFVPPNSTLVRKEVFDQVGLFDTNLKGADDFDMWYRIARVIPSTVHNKPLATWRYLSGSSISANDQLMLADEKAFYQKIMDGAEFAPEEKEEAKRGVERNQKRLANRLLVQGKYKEAAKFYGEARQPKLQMAAQWLPWGLRLAYQWKNRKPAFHPLNLDFS